jgi:hypothetical protein
MGALLRLRCWSEIGSNDTLAKNRRDLCEMLTSTSETVRAQLRSDPKALRLVSEAEPLVVAETGVSLRGHRVAGWRTFYDKMDPLTLPLAADAGPTKRKRPRERDTKEMLSAPAVACEGQKVVAELCSSLCSVNTNMSTPNLHRLPDDAIAWLIAHVTQAIHNATRRVASVPGDDTDTPTVVLGVHDDHGEADNRFISGKILGPPRKQNFSLNDSVTGSSAKDGADKSHAVLHHGRLAVLYFLASNALSGISKAGGDHALGRGAPVFDKVAQADRRSYRSNCSLQRYEGSTNDETMHSALMCQDANEQDASCGKAAHDSEISCCAPATIPILPQDVLACCYIRKKS